MDDDGDAGVGLVGNELMRYVDDTGVRRVESLQQLLTSSDCITLHCRHSDTPIINHATLHQMRRGRSLIHFTVES